MGARYRASVFLAYIILASATALAAEPELKHLYPVSGARGASIAINIGSKVPQWPLEMWADTPGIKFTPTPITGIFNAEIAPDASAGPHFVCLYNEEGASALRFFIVSQEADQREAEPNDGFKSPQSIPTLPATVNGRLDRGGDVDSYAVTLKRGETLVARLEAYVLASTFDGMLRIVNTDGIQMAFNHDGRTLDPFLTWEAPHDGTFIVQVMGFVHPANNSVQFTGGEGCVYRLHLTNGPFVRYTLPLGAQRGKKTPVKLIGWNLKSETDEIGCSGAALSLPAVDAEQAPVLSDIPEAIENEPNDATNAAQQLELPGAISGRIHQRDDEDRFTFTAVKKRSYELKITSAKAGSSLDAWQRIEDKDGKELARNDDSGSRDPKLTWTAPSDGVFTVAVGDLTHRGGDDFFYRLAITEAAPSVTATVGSHAFSIQPGKSSDVKVSVKPANGFKTKLQLTAKDLPEGVSAEPAEVPEKGGDVTLKLTASADAKPAGQPIRIVLRETEAGHEYPARFFLTETSENNGVPQGYSDLVIDSIEQLWLTITQPPAK